MRVFVPVRALTPDSTAPAMLKSLAWVAMHCEKVCFARVLDPAEDVGIGAPPEVAPLPVWQPEQA